MLVKDKKFISLSGNIAVGKTTLIRILRDKIPNSQIIEECPNDNPYINNFYQDMKRWCFISRIYFLVEKIVGYSSIKPETEFVLFDCSYDELHIFALHQFMLDNFCKHEYETYRTLFNAVKEILPKMDLFVYVYCSPQTSLQRIRNRGNKYEKNIDIEYIKALDMQYLEWIKTIQNTKIIKVNTDIPCDLDQLASQVVKYFQDNNS